MKVFTTVRELRKYRTEVSGSVGFVPTMGALHDGHLSLIDRSRSENSVTGCSIFVNPIQFNNPEDFKKYPSDLDGDLLKLIQAGCDFAFVPSAEEMYPETPLLKFDFGILEKVMEGAFRPGHFNGVAIVVSKLFHAAEPDRVYFGQKDLQQTLVIRRLMTDLSFRPELVIGETLRENDGLAMSSRNVRLTPEMREAAPVLYQTLKRIQKRILQGESISMVLREENNLLTENKAIRLEYLEAADTTALCPVQDDYKGELAVCVAAFLGNVRLIDNVVFVKM